MCTEIRYNKSMVVYVYITCKTLFTDIKESPDKEAYYVTDEKFCEF